MVIIFFASGPPKIRRLLLTLLFLENYKVETKCVLSLCLYSLPVIFERAAKIIQLGLFARPDFLL
jgi:hypothetical protein